MWLCSNVISQSGGVTLVDLGTGTSFDIKTLAPDVDYTTLTLDNFLVSNFSIYEGSNDEAGSMGTRNFFTNYDASTGVLTVFNYYRWQVGSYWRQVSISNYKIYLMY